MNSTASKQYNDSLTVADFARQESLDPIALHLLTYAAIYILGSRVVF